jgi:hypothetical protein
VLAWQCLHTQAKERRAKDEATWISFPLVTGDPFTRFGLLENPLLQIIRKCKWLFEKCSQLAVGVVFPWRLR